MKKLLVEKYRPSTIDGYVFQNEKVKMKVQKWIKSGDIPNLLFFGSSGTGKSTLAKILINELGIEPSDVKFVNASLVSGIGFVREELEPWMKKRAFGKYKVVILDEMDRLSKDAQKSLRAITEEYSNTVRFIGTANYPAGIIDAIHSRFQTIEMSSMDIDGVLDFVIDIVEEEGISINDEEDLMSHVDYYQPDIRKIINSIEEHTDDDKVLHALEGGSYGSDVAEWENIWSSGDVQDRIEDVVALTEHIDQNNFEWFYEVMYSNHQNFPDPHKGIILLSKYLDRAMASANQRLHLKAFLYHAFLVEE